MSNAESMTKCECCRQRSAEFSLSAGDSGHYSFSAIRDLPDFLLENPVVPNVLGTAYEVIVLDGKQVVTGVGGVIGDVWDGDWSGAVENLGQAGEGAIRVPVDIAVGIGRTVVDTSVEVGGVILDGAEAIGDGIQDGLSTVGGWIGL